MPSVGFQLCDPSYPAAADLSLRPRGHQDTYNSFSHGSTAPSEPGPPQFEVPGWHSDAPHSVGLLWTSDQPVAETSTWQHTTLTTNIHALGGIRTHDLSRRAAENLRLRQRGHWDRLYIKWVSWKWVLISCCHTPNVYSYHVSCFCSQHTVGAVAVNSTVFCQCSHW
jgi:hypothetical protein